MTNRRERKSWSALLLAMIVVILAACKGETPTAPPTGGGGGGGGGQSTTPTVVLTVSNASPVVDSTVTVTATVTINGAPAPNGTAIEFSTSAGNFTDTNPPSTALIRTTTNGVATVNLTHSSPGTARVTAVVNNVIRFIDVTFRTGDQCIPPAPGCPDDTLPEITGLSPTVGRPQGGETIRITGRNIKAPVKVLFDVGGVVPVEGFVTNVTSTFIDVITPAVNIGAGQQLNAPVIVITEAGTASEIRHTVAGGFTFRNTTLTPVVYSLSPTSGPINGGTRVTISGEAFQSPVQVFFGAAEVQVVEVDYGRIVVIAPEARATSANGSCDASGCTGPVAVSVVNINSNTRATSPQTFRYIAKMQITTLNPLVAPATGGTNIVIDGTGFDGPLQVTVNGLLAQVLGVSGTRLTVGVPAAPSPCSPPASTPSVFVTNTDNGDFDAWGDSINETNFTYLAIPAEITSVTSAAPGGTITVAVRNPGIGPLGEGSIRFTIVGRTIIPSPSLITTGTGTQNFSVTLPLTGFTFPTEACTTPGGGEPGVRFTSTEVPITFTNTSTGCTAQGTVIVQPPTPNPCLTEPQPSFTTSGCAPPASVGGPPAPEPTSTTSTITVSNDTEAQPLNITSVTISGPNAADFTIQPTSANNIAAGASRVFTVTFDPSVVGGKTATATFSTNSSSTPTFTVPLCGLANP